MKPSNSPKYTSLGLPIVSQEIVDEMFRDNSRTYGKGIEGILEDIKIKLDTLGQENPKLSEELYGVIDSAQRAENMDMIRQAHAMLSMYYLLRRQAEYNKTVSPTQPKT